MHSVAIAMRKMHLEELHKKAREDNKNIVIEALNIAQDHTIECSNSDYIFLYWDDGVNSNTDWFCYIMKFLERDCDFDLVALGDEDDDIFTLHYTGHNLLGIERKFWFSEVH